MKKLGIVIANLIFGSIAICSAEGLKRTPQTVFVIFQEVELRAEPTRDSKVVGTVTFGGKLQILEQRGDWLKVKKSTDTIQGWLHRFTITQNYNNIKRLQNKGRILCGVFWIHNITNDGYFITGLGSPKLEVRFTKYRQEFFLRPEMSALIFSDEPALEKFFREEPFWIWGYSVKSPQSDKIYYLNKFGKFEILEIDFPPRVEEVSKKIDYSTQAKNAFLQGDWDKVIEYGKEWTRCEPDNVIAHLILCTAYLHKKQYQNLSTESQVIKRSIKEEASLKDILLEWSKELAQDNPKNKYARLLCGSAYKYADKYEEAIIEYTKVIELAPEYAIAYNGRAVAYLKKGQHYEALIDCNKAIELDPKFAGAYVNRATIYASIGKYDEAIKEYTKAIKLAPKFAEAYDSRGSAYTCIGEYNKAIADHTKAIEFSPEYAHAYFNRGVAYGCIGKYNAAIADYTRAIELDPKFAAAYLNRGTAYGNRGEFQKAREDWQKAVELNPYGQYGMSARNNLAILEMMGY